MSRSNEAFWWSLFAAGGVLGALFIPVFVLLTGFWLPTAEPGEAAEHYTHLAELLGRWPVKIAVIAVTGLSCFLCAHRIRHTLMDLGLRGQAKVISLACYGAAILGVLAAVLLVARI